MGQKLMSNRPLPSSALTSTADITHEGCEVRKPSQYRKCALAVFDHLVGGTRSPTCATSVQYVAARLRVMIFALRSGAWFQRLSSERLSVPEVRCSGRGRGRG